MPIFNDLPRTLRTRRAEAVRNWPADAQCYVCLRTFGKKDDPTDIDEIACYPLSYPSCGHYVGSDCYRSMMSHNTVNVTCPFQCPVALDGPDPVPAWVRRLESIGMWETAELSTHALVECIPHCSVVSPSSTSRPSGRSLDHTGTMSSGASTSWERFWSSYCTLLSCSFSGTPSGRPGGWRMAMHCTSSLLRSSRASSC